MFLSKLSKFSLSLGLLSLIIILIYTGEIFLFPLYLLFCLLGFLLYRNKTERQFFFISLSISLLFIPFFTYSYIQETGFPFRPGGDAQYYYESFIDSLNILYNNMLSGRYAFYIYIGHVYYKVINILTHSTSYIYFVFLTMFISSNTAPLLYKLGYEKFNEKNLLYACLMTCFFPSLIQSNTAILREGMVIAPIMYCVYLSSKQSSVKNVLLFVLTLIYILNIRFEMGVVVIIFYILYNMVFVSKKNINAIKIIMIITFIILSISSLRYIRSLDNMNYWSLENKIEHLKEKSLAINGSESSLSTSLRQGGIFSKTILFFYCMYVPVPPDITVSPNLYNGFLAIGNILWYFILPISIIAMIKDIKAKSTTCNFSKSFLITFISAILMISLTYLGSERLKLYLYPILFIYFFNYLNSHTRRENFNMFRNLSLIYFLCFIVYMRIKYIFL